MVAAPASPPARRSVWWWLVPLGLLVPAALALGTRVGRERPETRVAPPEDSKLFQNALRLCRPLLPRNPRDLVRLVNRTRIQFLIQSRSELQDDARREAVRLWKDPFRGNTELDAWESVSLSVLQRRHPRCFQASVVEQKVIPRLEGRDFREVYAELAKEDPAFTDLPADIGFLETARGRDDGEAPDRDRELAPKPIEHLGDAEKLQRFVDVTRFLIDLGSGAPAAPTEATGPDAPEVEAEA